MLIKILSDSSQYKLTSVETRVMHDFFSIDIYNHMILKNKDRYIMQLKHLILTIICIH